MLRYPDFWSRRGLISKILWPLSLVYRFFAFFNKLFVKSYVSKVPIICIGNISVGGTGKTPVVAYFANELKKYNKNVHIVSRGYGGKLKGSRKVNVNKDNPYIVGDEPFMLAKYFNVWVGKNRKKSVLLAEKSGAEIIIFDDGMQNHLVKKDINILVVDGITGFGNGLIFPAGPLREKIDNVANKINMAVITGKKNENIEKIFEKYNLNWICAKSKIYNDNIKSNDKLVAFAGIGNPDKFFQSLENNGYDLVAKISYPDHYKYKKSDINSILEIANKFNAKIVTTSKDYVKVKHLKYKKIYEIKLKISFDENDYIKNIFNIILNYEKKL